VSDAEAAKRRAAQRASEIVQPGMRLGLGTGTTAHYFVEYLAARVGAGLDVLCVPTSEATRSHAAALNIPLTTLEETPDLDLTVDGTDEFDPQRRLIKGGGGALLREKIVATASQRLVIIADQSKQVAFLGRFPLPVEVIPFGLEATRRRVIREAARCGCHGEVRLRRTVTGSAFITDNGHYIVDCAFGKIPDPDALCGALNPIPGVVEHGLFIGLATAIIVADGHDLRILGALA
jgi:ribose 5-phosphate isomerase A